MKAQKLLMLSQDFKTWCESERPQKPQPTPRNTYLNQADKIAFFLFKKPFYECFTYEKDYIIKTIVNGINVYLIKKIVRGIPNE